MKHIFSIVAALCVLFSCVFLFGGCGEKHAIEMELNTGDLAPTLATKTDTVYLEITTGREVETVTNARDEQSTVAAAQTERTTKAVAEETAAAESPGATERPPEQREPATLGADALTTSPDVTVPAGQYQLSLKADKTEVRAGETITLTLHLKNCRNVGCFGFTVEYDDKVSVTAYKSNKFTNKNDESYQIYSNDTDEGVLFSGMITSTYDFLDDDLLTVTVRADSVKAGDELTFKAVPTTFIVADDASGAASTDYSAMLKEAALTVPVR